MPPDVFIIGSGHIKFGRLEQSLEDLIVEAGREAIAEAGIAPSDIDAVYLGHYNAGLVPAGFASSLILETDPGLRFKPAVRAENACASGSAAIHAWPNALGAGRARNVLVIGAE